MEFDWVKQFNAAFTVCDPKGIILYLNDEAASIFSKDGGSDLIGTNLLTCHPEPARSKLSDLLENPRVNIYSIEKKGKKKMIYQAPWFKEKEYAGLVEISFVLPADVPHFVRK